MENSDAVGYPETSTKLGVQAYSITPESKSGHWAAAFNSAQSPRAAWLTLHRT